MVGGFSYIEENVRQVRRRIAAAAQRSGRPAEAVCLIAVGKTQPADALAAVMAAGVRDIGENRVRELAAKREQLSGQGVWHLIGTLQRNKVKQVLGVVDLIQSVDSLDLAVEIDRRAERLGLLQSILVQVNVSGEATKHGVGLAELEKSVAQIGKLRHIKIDGLMTIAPLVSDREATRPVFSSLKEEYDRLCPKWGFNWLSMGMTQDFEVAVEEGSNMVRIGRAVFSRSS
jgi:PLP dependent protein